MNFSINNLSGTNANISNMISQIVAKKSNSLNSLIEQKNSIENTLAALRNGSFGGSVNSSYSSQISSLQDTIDRLKEQYTINENKLSTINSLKNSYKKTVSTLDDYINSLKNPSDTNVTLSATSSNNTVAGVTLTGSANPQRLDLTVSQMATCSTLTSTKIQGTSISGGTKVIDLFSGSYNSTTNTITSTRKDLSGDMKLSDLGITSGAFKLGSRIIRVDESETLDDLMAKINADSNYTAQIDYDTNTFTINATNGNSIAVTNAVGSLDVSGNISTTTTLSDIGVKAGTYFVGDYQLEVTEADTVGTLIDKIETLGYRAELVADVSNPSGKILQITDGAGNAVSTEATNFTSMAGFTVSEGTFSINGHEFTIESDTTIDDLVFEINKATADGVGAEFKDGKIVLTASKTGAIEINVEKGSSNFTNAIGFTQGGTMNTANYVLGTDGSYATLRGLNSGILNNDVAKVDGTGKFKTGTFTLSYTKIDANGSKTNDMLTTEITIDDGDTIDDIIAKIKTQTTQTWIDANGIEQSNYLQAEVVGGKFQIRQTVTGEGYNIAVVQGTSDFTNYVGLTANVTQGTSVLGSATTFTGVNAVTSDTTFTAGTFTITASKANDPTTTESVTIDVTDGENLQSVMQKINDSGLAITAKLIDNGDGTQRLQLAHNNYGSGYKISAVAGNSDFTEKVGFTSNVVVGESNTSTNSTLTGIISGLSASNTGYTDGSFVIRTNKLNSDGSGASSEMVSAVIEVDSSMSLADVMSAIDSATYIDASGNAVDMGLRASLTADGKIQIKQINSGEGFDIEVEAGDTNFTQSVGLTGSVTVGGVVQGATSTCIIGGTAYSGTFTEGSFKVTTNVANADGSASATMVSKDINIQAGKTLEEQLDDINAQLAEVGLKGSIVDGKLKIEQINTGEGYDIQIEAGSTDFTEKLGFTTSVTTGVSSEGAYAYLQGGTTWSSINFANMTTGEFTVSTNIVDANGNPTSDLQSVTIQVTAGQTAEEILANINTQVSSIGLSASIVDGKLTLTQTNTGEGFTIKVEPGTTNFTSLAGLAVPASVAVSTTATSTKLTGNTIVTTTSVEGTNFTDGSFKITVGRPDGTTTTETITVEVGDTLSSVASKITANENLGLNAYVDANGKFVIEHKNAGSGYTIGVETGNTTFTEYAGLTSTVTVGTSGQATCTTLTGTVTGLTNDTTFTGGSFIITTNALSGESADSATVQQIVPIYNGATLERVIEDINNQCSLIGITASLTADGRLRLTQTNAGAGFDISVIAGDTDFTEKVGLTSPVVNGVSSEGVQASLTGANVVGTYTTTLKTYNFPSSPCTAGSEFSSSGEIAVIVDETLLGTVEYTSGDITADILSRIEQVLKDSGYDDATANLGNGISFTINSGEKTLVLGDLSGNFVEYAGLEVIYKTEAEIDICYQNAGTTVTVGTAEELYNAFYDARTNPSLNIVLTNDIDMSAYSFANYAISNFNGILDGNGYEISNLNLSGSGDVALINNLQGTVKNVTFRNTQISHSGTTGNVAVVASTANGAKIQQVCIDNTSFTGSATNIGLLIANDNSSALSNVQILESKVAQADTSGLLIGNANGTTIKNFRAIIDSGDLDGQFTPYYLVGVGENINVSSGYLDICCAGRMPNDPDYAYHFGTLTNSTVGSVFSYGADYSYDVKVNNNSTVSITKSRTFSPSITGSAFDSSGKLLGLSHTRKTDDMAHLGYTAGTFVVSAGQVGSVASATITIESGDSLQDIIDKVNASGLGVYAMIDDDGKFAIKANETGDNYHISVESGTSNFLEKVGLATTVQSIGTLQNGTDAVQFSTLTGSKNITATTSVTAGSIKINGVTIDVSAGRLSYAISAINAKSDETGVKASIVSRKLVLTATTTGNQAIYVEGGTSNIADVTGLTTKATQAGVALGSEIAVQDVQLTPQNRITASEATELGYTQVTNALELIDALKANQNIVLMNDIDFSDFSSVDDVFDYNKVLNGNGYKIINYNMDSAIIDSTGAGAVIKNLEIEDSSVSFNTQGTNALLVAEANGSISFENIKVSNSEVYDNTLTNAENVVGLLLGQKTTAQDGTVTFDNIHLYNTTVNASYSIIGQLAGQISDTSFVDVKNITLENVNLTTQSGIVTGGLLGKVTDSTVSIYNTSVNVKIQEALTSGYSGAFVGTAGNSTVIIDNSFYNNVVGQQNIATTSDDYINVDYVGYYIGDSFVKIKNSYHTNGSISPTGSTHSYPPSFVGATYYEGAYKTRLTQAEAEALGYTCINSVSDFNTMLSANPSGKFMLMNNLDFYTVTAPNITNFSGTLDGNGFTISNLSSSNALFINTYSGAVIRNLNIANFNTSGGTLVGTAYDALTIENVNVYDSSVTSITYSGYEYAGGLVGVLMSSESGTMYELVVIDNVNTKNLTVNGEYSGGLVGCSSLYYDITNKLIIKNSNVNATLSGTYVGGLIAGISCGGEIIIDNISTSGTISGTSMSGGLIAESTGNPTRISNVFVDTTGANSLVAHVSGADITFTNIIHNSNYLYTHGSNASSCSTLDYNDKLSETKISHNVYRTLKSGPITVQGVKSASIDVKEYWSLSNLADAINKANIGVYAFSNGDNLSVATTRNNTSSAETLMNSLSSIVSYTDLKTTQTGLIGSTSLKGNETLQAGSFNIYVGNNYETITVDQGETVTSVLNKINSSSIGVSAELTNGRLVLLNEDPVDSDNIAIKQNSGNFGTITGTTTITPNAGVSVVGHDGSYTTLTGSNTLRVGMTVDEAIAQGYTIISTEADLAQLNGSSGKFFLANDIEITNVDNLGLTFSGELNGNGHTISTSVSTQTGLFEVLTGDTVTIKNLTLSDFNITSSNQYSAILAEQSTATTLNIENVAIKNSIIHNNGSEASTKRVAALIALSNSSNVNVNNVLIDSDVEIIASSKSTICGGVFANTNSATSVTIRNVDLKYTFDTVSTNTAANGALAATLSATSQLIISGVHSSVNNISTVSMTGLVGNYPSTATSDVMLSDIFIDTRKNINTDKLTISAITFATKVDDVDDVYIISDTEFDRVNSVSSAEFDRIASTFYTNPFNQISAGTVNVNGKTITLQAGTVHDAIDTINSHSAQTGVTASIENNKLVFKNTAMNKSGITVTEGTSNFVEITGTAGYAISAPTITNIAGSITGTNAVQSSQYTQAEAEAMGYTWIDSADEFFSAISANATGKFMLGCDLDLSGYGDSGIYEFSGVLDGNGFTLNYYNGTTSLLGDSTGATVRNLKIHGFEVAATAPEIEDSSSLTTIVQGAHPLANQYILNVTTTQGTVDLAEAITTGVNGVSTAPFIAGINMLTEEDALAQGYTLIKTAEDLQNIQNNLSGKYILMNDIDLTGVEWTGITDTFTGTFNGNGFVISNLSGSQGLFTQLSGASIKNLGLEQVNINATTDVGAIASGLSSGDNVVIDNVYVTGSITQTGSYCKTGGLVGAAYYDLTIKNSSVSAEIVTNYGGGGLVDTADDLVIDKSFVTGTINTRGYSVAGGFVGSVDNLVVTDSYSNAQVSSSSYHVGGIAANVRESITISNVFSLGEAVSTTSLYNESDAIARCSDSVIINCSNVFYNSDLGSSTIEQATGLTTEQFADDSSFTGWDTSIWDFSGDGHPEFVKNLSSIVFTDGSLTINGNTINASDKTIAQIIFEINSLNIEGLSASIVDNKFTIIAQSSIPTISATGDFATITGLVNPTTQFEQKTVSVNTGFIGSIDRLTESEAIAQGYTVIKTAEDLQNINNNLSGKYMLMNNIDLSGINWTGIGTSSDTAFSGTFDGNGYIISNLTSDTTGLFSYVNGATIKNIGLDLVNINVNSGSASALAVDVEGPLAVSNVYATGQIYSTYGYAAGLIADSSTDGTVTITDSYVDAQITTVSTAYTNSLGGLLARAYAYGEIIIKNCFTTGKLESRNDYKSNYEYAGGLVGDAGSVHLEIYNSYSSMDFSGKLTVGGLVGCSDDYSTYIQDSYACGLLDSLGEKKGAIIGDCQDTSLINLNRVFYNEEMSGAPSISGIALEDDIYATALNSIQFKDSELFYGWDETVWSFSQFDSPKLQMAGEPRDIALSEIVITDGTFAINGLSINVTNKTIAQIVDEVNNLNISGLSAAIVDDVFTITSTKGEPTISATGNFAFVTGLDQPISKLSIDYESAVGVGFVSEVVKLSESEAIAQGYTVIKTVEDLQNIDNNLSGKYMLMNDIDLSGVNWTGIASGYSDYFNGTFDGNGYVIRNLTGSQGLFANASGAIIQNIGLEGVNITTDDANVGAIAGSAITCEVSNVYVVGDMFAYFDVGGIIGEARGVNLINSYAHVDIVSEDGYAGGLIGRSYYYTDSISNCFTTGSLVSERSASYEYIGSYVGGLVGSVESDMTITNSFSTMDILIGKKCGGLVGGVSSSDEYHTVSLNISNSYAAGSFGSNTASVGSIIGEISDPNNVVLDNAYYDSSRYICSNLNGTGLTPEQLADDSNFSSWDNTIWDFSGDGAPTLKIGRAENNNVAPVASTGLLFGSATGAMTFENISISQSSIGGSGTGLGLLTGSIFSDSYENSIFDNIKITESSVAGDSEIASLAGTVMSNGNVVVNNVEISDLILDAANANLTSSGALFGHLNANTIITNTNVNLSNYAPYADCGGMVGVFDSEYFDNDGRIANLSFTNTYVNASQSAGGKGAQYVGTVLGDSSAISYKNAYYNYDASTGATEGGTSTTDDYETLFNKSAYNTDWTPKAVAMNASQAQAAGYTCIYTADDFVTQINANKNGKFMLMNDIDLTGVTSIADGFTNFNGILDGNGYTIKNFTSTVGGALFASIEDSAEFRNFTLSGFNVSTETSTRAAALLMKVQAGRTVIIENVKLENSSITGKYLGVAGIVAYTSSSAQVMIDNVYVDSNVTIANNHTNTLYGTAGIIGHNASVYGFTSVRNSYSAATVNGVGSSGQVIGYTSSNSLIIDNVRTAGSVTGKSVGAIVGKISDTEGEGVGLSISNVYSSTKVIPTADATDSSKGALIGTGTAVVLINCVYDSSVAGISTHAPSGVMSNGYVIAVDTATFNSTVSGLTFYKDIYQQVENSTITINDFTIAINKGSIQSAISQINKQSDLTGVTAYIDNDNKVKFESITNSRVHINEGNGNFYDIAVSETGTGKLTNMSIITGSRSGLTRDMTFGELTGNDSFSNKVLFLCGDIATFATVTASTTLGQFIDTLRETDKVNVGLDENGCFYAGLAGTTGLLTTNDIRAALGFAEKTYADNAVLDLGEEAEVSSITGTKVITADTEVSSGDFIINYAGDSTKYTVTEGMTMQDVVAMINRDDPNLSVEIVNGKIYMYDVNGLNERITITNGTSNFTELAGFTYGAEQSVDVVAGKNAVLLSQNTALSAQGMYTAGDFSVTTDSGSATITIEEGDTINDIIEKINSCGLNVNAYIDDATGKLAIERGDSSTYGSVSVNKGSSNFTNVIGFTSGGEQTAEMVDGSHSVLVSQNVATNAKFTSGYFFVNAPGGGTIKVNISSSDTAEQVAQKITNLNLGLTAYIDNETNKMVITSDSEGTFSLDKGSSDFTTVMGFSSGGLETGTLSQGTTAKLTSLNSADSVTGLTAGTFVINGTEITITDTDLASADTMQIILDKITANTDVTASLDANNRIVLTRKASAGAGNIVVEKGTSNFTTKYGFTSGGASSATLTMGTDAVLRSGVTTLDTVVGEGTFYVSITGENAATSPIEIVVSQGSTVQSVISQIDALNGVSAKFDSSTGQVVIEKEDAYGDGTVKLSSGSSNFVSLLGFEVTTSAVIPGTDPVYSVQGSTIELSSAPTSGFISEITRLSEAEAIAQGYTVIKSAEDLQNIANNMSGKYMLMNDIDLSDINWTGISSGYFSGTFDGNGYSIKNLTGTQGLFDNINNATIRNLGMENVNIQNTATSGEVDVGAIAGKSFNVTVIDNVFVTGTVSAVSNDSTDVGGLVGDARGTFNLSNSYSNAYVQGRTAGGLLGLSYSNTTITNSFAAGSVESTGFSECIAGGLVAFVYGESINISDSYSIANVNATDYAGGIFGISGGNANSIALTLNRVISAGTVSSNHAISSSARLYSKSVQNVYYNSSNSLTDTVGIGATGLTTEQLSDDSNFSSWDSTIWDFSGDGTPTLVMDSAVMPNSVDEIVVKNGSLTVNGNTIDARGKTLYQVVVELNALNLTGITASIVDDKFTITVEGDVEPTISATGDFATITGFDSPTVNFTPAQSDAVINPPTFVGGSNSSLSSANGLIKSTQVSEGDFIINVTNNDGSVTKNVITVANGDTIESVLAKIDALDALSVSWNAATGSFDINLDSDSGATSFEVVKGTSDFTNITGLTVGGQTLVTDVEGTNASISSAPVSSNRTFTEGDFVINLTGNNAGQVVIDVEEGDTAQDIVDKINAKNTGLIAEYNVSTGVITITRDESLGSGSLSVGKGSSDFTTIAGFTSGGGSSATFVEGVDAKIVSAYSAGPNQTFTEGNFYIELTGENSGIHSIDVSSTDKINDVVRKINEANIGVFAYVDDSNKLVLERDADMGVGAVKVLAGSSSITGDLGLTSGGAVTGSLTQGTTSKIVSTIDHVSVGNNYTAGNFYIQMTESNSSSFIKDINRISEAEAIAQGYTVIKTAEDLQNISNNLSGKYMLMSDIDLSGINWTGISSSQFRGTFDGNGYSIKNLTGSQGLFANVNNATIRNLGMENVNIQNTATSGEVDVGAIAGKSYGSTVIDNVFVTGSVTAINDDGLDIGGLVGDARGTFNLSNSYSNANVSGKTAGGLLGLSDANTTITNSFSYGSVNSVGFSNDYSGGLIGYAYRYTVDISNSYSSASVNGTLNSGGILGAAGSSNSISLTLNNVLSLGNVSSNGSAIAGKANISSKTVSGVYYNSSNSLTDTVGIGATGLTTEQLSDDSNFSTWDTSIWDLSGDGTPTLGTGVVCSKLIEVNINSTNGVVDDIYTIISNINAQNAGVTASLNSDGKVVIQRDQTTSAGGLTIIKGTSDFTNKFGFTSGGGAVDGTYIDGLNSTRTTLSSQDLGSKLVSDSMTLGSIGVKGGVFKLNGVDITVKTSDTIYDLAARINSVFSADEYADRRVSASYENGELVIRTQNSGSTITVERGTTNFTDIANLTNAYQNSEDLGITDLGHNAHFNINGTDYDMALDLNENGENMLYLDKDGNVVTDSSDAAIEINIKKAGNTVIEVGRAVLDDSVKKLQTFINRFNAAMNSSSNSIMADDTSFTSFINRIRKALTNNVGDIDKITSKLAEIGIVIKVAGGSDSSMGIIQMSLTKTNGKYDYVEAFYKDPQHVMDLLIGDDSEPIDHSVAGVFTRLSDVLHTALEDNRNGYFKVTPRSIESQQKALKSEITSLTFDLNELKNQATGGGDGAMNEYLSQLEAQYQLINKAIADLNKQYNSSLVRLILNQNNAAFNPIVS